MGVNFYPREQGTSPNPLAMAYKPKPNRTRFNYQYLNSYDVKPHTPLSLITNTIMEPPPNTAPTLSKNEITQ